MLSDVHLIRQKEEPLLGNEPDHLLHRFPALNLTCRRKQHSVHHLTHTETTSSLMRPFSTCGIPRVDDIQSDRLADSLCRLQRSLQLLHLQLPAALLTQAVGNGHCAQSHHGAAGRGVARQWSQHTGFGRSLAVHQDIENILMSGKREKDERRRDEGGAALYRRVSWASPGGPTGSRG